MFVEVACAEAFGGSPANAEIHPSKRTNPNALLTLNFNQFMPKISIALRAVELWTACALKRGRQTG